MTTKRTGVTTLLVAAALALAGCGGSAIRVNGNGGVAAPTTTIAAAEKQCDLVSNFQLWIFTATRDVSAGPTEKERALTGLRSTGKELTDAFPQYKAPVQAVIDDQREKLGGIPAPAGKTPGDAYKTFTQFLASCANEGKASPGGGASDEDDAVEEVS